MYRIRPISAVVALCCFLFPWINIQCHVPNHGLLESTQSGLQMLYGGTTSTVGGKPVSDAERLKNARVTDDREKPVPLVILCAISLLATLVFSLTISDRDQCWLLATSASGLAAACFILQVTLGFPLVRDIPRGNGGWNYTPWFWLALISIIAVFLVSVRERLSLPFPNTKDDTASIPVIPSGHEGATTTWAQRVQAMTSQTSDQTG